MKNLIKVSSYTLATALVFVLSQTSAFAAGTTANDSTLSFGQVIGGVVLLIAVILVPTMKSARKAKA
jgi:ethanolamine transporter EutH